MSANWVFSGQIDWLQAERVVQKLSDPGDAHRREKRKRRSEELEDEDAQEKPDPDEVNGRLLKHVASSREASFLVHF
jgi:DNA-nicking Smr family endonuclease